MITEEIWKDIPGYEGLYQASSLGRIKSCQKVLRYRNGKIVHRNECIMVLTNDEWSHSHIAKYVIVRICNNIDTSTHSLPYGFLAFHTTKQRDLFLKENEDLVKDYLMID